jgi:hypothetical protein
MIEGSWLAVAPQAFTANGTQYGLITLASTAGFYTRQIVTIQATALPDLQVQVKRVNADGATMIVGPTDGNIGTWSNIALYTTAATSTVRAAEQRRAALAIDAISRAVFQEDPVVALRVVLVDGSGNVLGVEGNPLHTTTT